MSIKSFNQSSSSLNAHQNTISDLKQFQIFCDERLDIIRQKLDNEYQLKLPDYKECLELIKQTERVANRWKRMTSLTVESMIELDNELSKENFLISQMKTEIQDNDIEIHNLKEEINNMENLYNLLKHFTSKAEERKQQQLISTPTSFSNQNNSTSFANKKMFTF